MLRSQQIELAAGYGRDQQEAIAFLDAAGFAAEKADVFFVEINVEELADLAALVAHVSREVREARGQFRKSFGNGVGTTVHLRRAVGEAAERRGYFDGHWHLSVSFKNAVIQEPGRQDSRTPNPRHALAAVVAGSCASR